MTTTTAQLCDVIDSQSEMLVELVAMLQADQQRIIDHDIDGLEQSNRSKEQHVLLFQSVEQKRQGLVEQIGRELGLPAEQVRVSQVAPMLGGDGARLEAAAERLRAIVASLGELIAVSRGFVEQSVLGMRSMIQLIESLRSPDPGGYDASGRLLQTRESAPVAVRREA